MNLTPSLKKFPLGAIRNPQIDERFPVEGLEELRIAMQSVGSMMICFDAVDEARIIATGDEHQLPARMERVGGTLFVASRKLEAYLQKTQNQELVIEIHVPHHTRLNLKMLAGVVMVKGGVGDVSIDAKAGEITGVTLAQNVDIKLQAGDISFNDLQGNAKVNVSFGAVTLGWEKLSGDENINISCGCGSIDLRLPEGTTAPRDFGGLMQHKTLKLPNGTHIHAKVNMGSLDIRHWQVKRGGRMGIVKKRRSRARHSRLTSPLALYKGR
jgi:hypothetical protein